MAVLIIDGVAGSTCTVGIVFFLGPGLESYT
jgi:hypothetical protein